MTPFPSVGEVWRIASVNHPVFSSEIGAEVIIQRLVGNVAYVSRNKPVTYRINRLGQRVIDHDPRCIQTLYRVSQLEPAAGVVPNF